MKYYEARNMLKFMWKRISLFLFIPVLSSIIFVSQTYAYDDDSDDSSQDYDDSGDDDGQSYDSNSDDSTDDSADDSVDDSTLNNKTSTSNKTATPVTVTPNSINASTIPISTNTIGFGLPTTQNSVNIGNLLSMNPEHAQRQLTQMINSLSTVRDHLINNPSSYNQKALAIGFAVLKQLIEMGALRANAEDIDSFISGATLFKTSVINNATTNSNVTTPNTNNTSLAVSTATNNATQTTHSTFITKTVNTTQRNRVFIYPTQNKRKSYFVYKQKPQDPQIILVNKYVEPNGMIATQVPTPTTWHQQHPSIQQQYAYNKYIAQELQHLSNEMYAPYDDYNYEPGYAVYQGYPTYTAHRRSALPRYDDIYYGAEEQGIESHHPQTADNTEYAHTTPPTHQEQATSHNKRSDITIQIANKAPKNHKTQKSTISIVHRPSSTTTNKVNAKQHTINTSTKASTKDAASASKRPAAQANATQATQTSNNTSTKDDDEDKDEDSDEDADEASEQ